LETSQVDAPLDIYFSICVVGFACLNGVTGN